MSTLYTLGSRKSPNMWHEQFLRRVKIQQESKIANEIMFSLPI